MILWIMFSPAPLINLLCNKQAKSQCNPSSRDISSFENVKPGIKPRFFNQNIAQNEPEKKIPSTAAKATSLCANEPFFLESHLRAHSPFFLTDGTVSSALNKWFFSSVSVMYVSIRREYVSAWMFSIIIWNP